VITNQTSAEDRDTLMAHARSRRCDRLDGMQPHEPEETDLLNGRCRHCDRTVYRIMREQP